MKTIEELIEELIDKKIELTICNDKDREYIRGYIQDLIFLINLAIQRSKQHD